MDATRRAHGNFKDEEMMPVGSESFSLAARLRSSFPFGLMTNDGSRPAADRIQSGCFGQTLGFGRPPADQTRPSAAICWQNLGHVISPATPPTGG
jgi:hypothetical protein